MKSIYDFGITQDDPHVEECGLQLEDSNLLCIASAGDFPLTVLSKYNTKIRAVDVSENQIRLCRLKLIAAITLEPLEAAQLIGFQKTTCAKRRLLFTSITKHLDSKSIDFWKLATQNWRKDPIGISRFEYYLSLFCRLAKHYMGEKKLRRFSEMDAVTEQKIYFETHFRTFFIKYFFKIAFSPLLYKKRGLDEQGLMHQKENLAQKFYNKFKAFFTATPARFNVYLHYYLFGNISSETAFPDYLKETHHSTLLKHTDNIQFSVEPMQEFATRTTTLNFKNIALSNISDWMDVSAMDDLLINIRNKTHGPTTIMMRYIHKDPLYGEHTRNFLKVDNCFEKKVNNVDRFPFYSIVKAQVEHPILKNNDNN